ncbi:hypothetical protein [Parvularcula sp. IMCC14364]|uniref:hypothetical protein n=1 Tax=Parvularcula sp. IMCC14364 TaxID=3067902 RepID=UPI0027412214|nr:hypothetical protein [Parvularcula sp. IMCC14364]
MLPLSPSNKLAYCLALLAFICACTTTRSMQTTNDVTIEDGALTVLLVEPDVRLSFLKASGIAEVRADWTRQGSENLLASMQDALAASDHEIISYSLNDAKEREIQLVRLHESVGETILLHRFLGVPLPTKENTFDWSLGSGVQVFKGTQDADYLLFLFARGAYASSGRQAMAIGLAVAGVGGIGTGGQAAYASLVDTRTGDIVWFNVAQTGPGTDMRKPEGAASLIETIFKDMPLIQQSEDAS